MSGYFIDVIQMLEDTLHFEANLVPSVDGFWGSEDAGGEWNGMVGMVSRGEADMVGSAMSSTSARAEVSRLAV